MMPDERTDPDREEQADEEPRCRPDLCLRAVDRPADVFPAYRDTPIEKLLLAQNLGQRYEKPAREDLAIATSDDPRVDLRVPDRAVLMSRTVGVSLDSALWFEFLLLAHALRIAHLAVIVHDDRAMSRLPSRHSEPARRSDAAGGAGTAVAATSAAGGMRRAPGDPLAVAWDHVTEFRYLCNGMLVAPLLYTVGDGRLLQIDEIVPF